MLPVERLAIAIVSTMLFARRETGETPFFFVTMFALVSFLGDMSTLRGTTSLLSESSFLFLQLFRGETTLFFNVVMLSLEGLLLLCKVWIFDAALFFNMAAVFLGAALFLDMVLLVVTR